MIQISFKFDSEGCPIGVRCSGHAGYARRGKDIICAAVSTLVINTINSVEKFTDSRFVLETNEKKAIIYFLLEDPDDDSKLLMKSLHLGIQDIITDNGKDYIQLVDWEV